MRIQKNHPHPYPSLEIYGPYLNIILFMRTVHPVVCKYNYFENIRKYKANAQST